MRDHRCYCNTVGRRTENYNITKSETVNKVVNNKVTMPDTQLLDELLVIENQLVDLAIGAYTVSFDTLRLYYWW